MKNQAYRMALLFDFYGDMLTDRQKEFFDLYYNEDLSTSITTRTSPWLKLPRTTTLPARASGT